MSTENIAEIAPQVERAAVLEYLRPTRAYHPGSHTYSLPTSEDDERTCYVINDVDTSVPSHQPVKGYHVGAPRAFAVEGDLLLLTERRPPDVPKPNVLVLRGEGLAIGIWRLREPSPTINPAKQIAARVGGQPLPEHGYIQFSHVIDFDPEHDYALPEVAKVGPVGVLRKIDIDLDAVANRCPSIKSEAWEAITQTNGDFAKLGRLPLGPTHTDLSRSGTGFWLLIHLAGAGLSDDELFTIWATEPIGEYARDKERDFVPAMQREIARARQRVATEKAVELLRPVPPAAKGDWNLSPLPDPIPARPIIVKGLLQRQVVTLVAGKGGDGKSLFTLQMAVAAALGVSWAGFEPVKPLKVLYINSEDDRDEIQRRLAAICIEMGVDADVLHGKLHHWPVGQIHFVERLPGPGEQALPTGRAKELVGYCQQEGYDIVVMDPLVEMGKGINENDNNDMMALMSVMRDIARRADVALLLVHHFRKQGVGGDADSMRGGSAIVNACRLALTFERLGADSSAPRFKDVKPENVIKITGAKANYQPKNGAQYLAFVPHQVNEQDWVAALKPLELTPAETFEEWDALVQLVAQGNEEGRPWSPATKGPKNRRLDEGVAARFSMTIETARKVIAAAAGHGRIIEGEATVNKEKVRVWQVGGEVPF